MLEGDAAAEPWPCRGGRGEILLGSPLFQQDTPGVSVQQLGKSWVSLQFALLALRRRDEVHQGGK